MNKQLRAFVSECVDHYAKYDKLDDFYSIDLYDLPDFVQHEFAGMIMADDEAYAIEATGPDNKHWENKMQPALIHYLKNSTDRDEAIEFNRIWLDCVTDYVKNRMQELLDESLVDFNFDHGFARPEHYNYGVPLHGSL